MSQPIDDHFLLRYRQLLDAEDAAFDEVEHACEDGDRPHFDEEMVVWQSSLAKKLSFLSAAGIDFEFRDAATSAT
ncbi:MAG: hypothetical protein ACRDWE_01625 [Acidimicrobiales bacterium]